MVISQDDFKEVKKRHLILRAARGTKYLPAFKGLTALLSLYRRCATHDLMRIHDFDGDLQLDVTVRETIGINLWHAPKLFEKREREAFCSAIRPGCAVLDVGANIGIYTLLAAKRGARVFAIEMDPKNAVALRRHVELNGFGKTVTVYEMAATEREKPVPLFRNPLNTGGSNLFSGPESAGFVPGRTIDSLHLPPIDLCKMDIEGYEFLALQGMKETIGRSPKLQLLIEWFSKHRDAEGLFKYLRENFADVRVVGSERSTEFPEFCNLWACR